MPNDYSQPFFITEAVGNNAFSFDERKGIHTPKLYVPALIEGRFEDVMLGNEIVFEEYENGKIQPQTGLKNFVHTKIGDKDIYIFDNHNHALYFWSLHSRFGIESGLGLDAQRQKVRTHRSPTLIHIDQHSDMRVPEMSFETFCRRGELQFAPTQENIFRYTNFHLNIGNFIIPAQQMGIIGDIIQVTGSIDDFVGKKSLPASLEGGAHRAEGVLEKEEEHTPSFSSAFPLPLQGDQDKTYILDIDLDYFAPEMDFLPHEPRMQLIRDLLSGASVVTIATSPYFIDQTDAIELLHELFGELLYS